jgi:hypothetical protein
LTVIDCRQGQRAATVIDYRQGQRSATAACRYYRQGQRAATAACRYYRQGQRISTVIDSDKRVAVSKLRRALVAVTAR